MRKLMLNNYLFVFLFSLPIFVCLASNSLIDANKNNHPSISTLSKQNPSNDWYLDSISYRDAVKELQHIRKDINLNEANRQFGFKLLESIAEDKKNFSISPLSLAIGISMLSEGASGETLTELKTFLTSGLVSYEEFVECMKRLSTFFNYENDLQVMRLANALMVNTSFKVCSNYVDLIKSQYHAGIFNLNLFKRSSVSIINNWCRNQTYGQIENFLTEPPRAQMAILNAFFLATKWGKSFDYLLTCNENFTNADGTTVSVPFMKVNALRTLCSENQYFTKVVLNTKSDIEVILFLPKEGVNMSPKQELEELRNIYSWQLNFYSLNLQLPKFSISDDINLIDNMRRLGVNCVFDPLKANLFRVYNPKSVDDNLYVFKVEQKDLISIDETGISASAITIILDKYSAFLDRSEFEKKDIVFNRPFYYCIKSRYADVFYFFGKINQLSEE